MSQIAEIFVNVKKMWKFIYKHPFRKIVWSNFYVDDVRLGILLGSP